MSEQRANFNKMRKRIMKEHSIVFLICARCGHISASVHLHHIMELSQGGENHTSNLIPLCGTCHIEWDSYACYMELNSFLKTPNAQEWSKLLNHGMQKDNRISVILKGLELGRKIVGAVEYNSITGSTTPYAFYEEVKRQNDVFPAFEYAEKFNFDLDVDWVKGQHQPILEV